MNEYEMEWHIIKKSDDKKFQFKTYQAYNFFPLKNVYHWHFGRQYKNN